MNESSVPPGIWKSRYTYPSSGHEQEFTGEHYVRVHQLSIHDNIATGSWQEQTEPEDYYKGAVYYGAAQLAVRDDGKKMSGKWVGFGKDMEVNVGPWELNYRGKSLPKVALAEHMMTAD